MTNRDMKPNLLFCVGILIAAFSLSSCLGDMPWRGRMIDARSSLRKIEAAQKTHKAQKGSYGTLRQLAVEGLIKGDLARGIGDGYKYEVTLKGDSYEAVAIPAPANKKLPTYLLDGLGVIHQSDLGETEVTVYDPPAPQG